MMMMMRTTINIPEDVYEIIRNRAYRLRIPIGEALASIVRERAESSKILGIDESGAFPKFILPPDSPPLTLEQIEEAREDW